VNAKKILSHIYPATIKSGITKQGQAYEINFENGNKVLNSQNANYSYGSLHQVMQKGIFESLKLITPKKILMLGLGAGSAVEILNKKCDWPIEITAVELDEDLVGFALNECDIGRFRNLTIITANAFEWLKQAKDLQFDLIIDDIFLDDKVPAECFEKEYLASLSGLLSPNGIYFRNMMNIQDAAKLHYDQQLNTIFKSVTIRKTRDYENLIYLCQG
jgi:spermidine synthase